MNGVAEVLQTIGATMIFSMILLTSNRMILSNSFREVESEAEGIAITQAQNIIEEAQTKAFDETTTEGNVPLVTPAQFSKIDAEEGSNRKDFDDFDDYDGYSETIDTEFGTNSFNLAVEVAYVSSAGGYDIDQGSKSLPTHFKKMRVTVTSIYLENSTQEIQLEYLQRYYKTKNE